jgi:hypothetical protein
MTSKGSPSAAAEFVGAIWPLLLMGSVLLTWAAVQAYRTMQFTAGSDATLATIVDVIEHPSDDRGWHQCSLEVEFAVDGKQIRATVGAPGHFDKRAEGNFDPVEIACGVVGSARDIRFDRRDPSQARLVDAPGD